jgi:SAM-dependent methyltransferase
VTWSDLPARPGTLVTALNPGSQEAAPSQGPPKAERPSPASDEVEQLRRSFDGVAEEYAAEFLHELDHKPFDTDRLRQFARGCTNRGLVLDVGCGPGHVGRFLAGEFALAEDQGEPRANVRVVEEAADLPGRAGLSARRARRWVVGVDVSEVSLRIARRSNPALAFVAADMQTLPLREGACAGLVAFYSLIYWEPATVAAILREFRRVLRPGRPMLLAVHAGEGSERFTEFRGKPIEITLRYHQPERLAASVKHAGFVVDAVETRPPYPFEHPTTRLYVAARAR